MKRGKVLKIITAILLVALLAGFMVACGPKDEGKTPVSEPGNNTANNEPKEPAKNTKPIVVTWYPNESSDTHKAVRDEVGRLIEGGPFFSEVYFGGSHQGSAINLLSGNADVAAFCDIEVQPYVEMKSGGHERAGERHRESDGE